MTYVRYIDKTREYYRAKSTRNRINGRISIMSLFSRSPSLADSRVALVSTGEVEVKEIGLSEDENQMGNVGSVCSTPSTTPDSNL